MTANPAGLWIAKIALNVSMFLAKQPAEFRAMHIVRNRNTRFTDPLPSGREHLLQFDPGEFHHANAYRAEQAGLQQRSIGRPDGLGVLVSDRCVPDGR
jgi:hypothetical protein